MRLVSLSLLNLVEVCREFWPEFCVDALEERCGWPLVPPESLTFKLPLSPLFESARSSLLKYPLTLPVLLHAELVVPFSTFSSYALI